MRDANHNAFGYAAVPEYVDGRRSTSILVGDIPHTATALSFGCESPVRLLETCTALPRPLLISNEQPLSPQVSSSWVAVHMARAPSTLRSTTQPGGRIGQGNSQLSATSGPSDHRADQKVEINRMSEREIVVELPFAAD